MFHGLYQCAGSKEQIAEITWTYFLFLLAWLCTIFFQTMFIRQLNCFTFTIKKNYVIELMLYVFSKFINQKGWGTIIIFRKLNMSNIEHILIF